MTPSEEISDIGIIITIIFAIAIIAFVLFRYFAINQKPLPLAIKFSAGQWDNLSSYIPNNVFTQIVWIYDDNDILYHEKTSEDQKMAILINTNNLCQVVKHGEYIIIDGKNISIAKRIDETKYRVRTH